MSIPQDHHRMPEFPGHEELLRDPFAQRAAAAPPYSNSPYPGPYYQVPKKRKWAAGVLSFLVPGTGQFYLGLMSRGLIIMMMLIIDIVLMVSINTQGHGSTPLMTLFALFLPVIYFYNLFDALQSTDNVNRRNEFGEFASQEDPNDPLQKLMRGGNVGVLLIAAGVLFFLLSSKPRWFETIFNLMGSYIGSAVLIVAGLAIFLLGSRKNR